MGCCKNCDTQSPRVTRELTFDITEIDSACDAFKGKNLKLLSFRFLPGLNHNIEKVYYAKLTHHTNDTMNITVYQERLPFDELVMTIVIDGKTGRFSARSYTLVANQFVLEIEHDDDQPPEPKGYIDLGNSSYRVTTFKGARDLFHTLKLRTGYLDDFLNMYALHAKGAEPVLVISSHPNAVSMTTPLHPTWKDDSLWK